MTHEFIPETGGEALESTPKNREERASLKLCDPRLGNDGYNNKLPQKWYLHGFTWFYYDKSSSGFVVKVP